MLIKKHYVAACRSWNANKKAIPWRMRLWNANKKALAPTWSDHEFFINVFSFFVSDLIIVFQLNLYLTLLFYKIYVVFNSIFLRKNVRYVFEH